MKKKKTRKSDAELRKKYEEMNIRNNNIANDLQVLRRNLANLNEQLDFAKETEKQFEMDYNAQEVEYKILQTEISDLEVIIRDIKEKRVDKSINVKVEQELKTLERELEQLESKHKEINLKNSKIEVETLKLKKEISIIEESLNKYKEDLGRTKVVEKQANNEEKDILQEEKNENL